MLESIKEAIVTEMIKAFDVKNASLEDIMKFVDTALLRTKLTACLLAPLKVSPTYNLRGNRAPSIEEHQRIEDIVPNTITQVLASLPRHQLILFIFHRHKGVRRYVSTLLRDGVKSCSL